MAFDAAKLFLQARLLAAKRRAALFLRGDFDPYPRPPQGLSLSPSQRNRRLGRDAPLRLGWAACPEGEIGAWREEARAKLRELLRLPERLAPATPVAEADLPIADGYTRRRLYLNFAPGSDAPLDIVHAAAPPAPSASPAPVVICMQGTNAGAHLSLGEVRMPADVAKVARGSALALQAAGLGYTAVSFERAGFGERRERALRKAGGSPTADAALHALVVGRTLLGQTAAELEGLRLWIGRELAPGAPVYLAGYSAAGTAAIAAAALFPGFAGIGVGGCVGFIRDTLLTRPASGFNEIPDMLNWFEFDALLALIAPRPCLVVAGASDHIWPHAGAAPVVASAARAYDAANAPDALRLIEAPGGHTYYPDLFWPALRDLIEPTA